MNRARPYLLAASAAAVLLAGIGGGHVLSVQPAASHTPVAEAALATTTTTAPTTTTAAPVETTTTSALPAPTTTAAPRPTTTAAPAIVCQWTAKIVSGGIPESSNETSWADQFVVTVTKSSWAGRPVSRVLNYSLPAKSRGGYAPRIADVIAPTVTANENGTATFVIPIGPESQGGLVSILARSRGSNRRATATADDVCDWHPFTIDYDGPEGLAGGVAASGATKRS